MVIHPIHQRTKCTWKINIEICKHTQVIKHAVAHTDAETHTNAKYRRKCMRIVKQNRRNGTYKKRCKTCTVIGVRKYFRAMDIR